MRPMRLLLAAAVTVLAAPPGVLTAQGYGPTPVTLPDETLDGRLHVPRGVTVSEFAKVAGARAMVLGPDGAIYVSRPQSGEVVRLADTNGDGIAESPTVAVSGLNRPHGMAFHDGWFYVANTDAVVRVKLDASGTAIGTPEHLVSYPGRAGHWTRTVVFGPDGGMYVSIGSSCNICEETAKERATVMRYDADGKNGRVYSAGLRNAVGMAVHPVTREMWVTQNERDDIRPDHQDLPPEEINILRDGGDFGWPYCHSNRVPNPEFANASRCAGTIPPALAMQAHSAPLGITFLDRATLLPAELRGDALVAFHGSWNRDTPTGYKVVRIRIRDGKPVGYEDFITGWQSGTGRPWGRPVDLLVARDGSVIVSDDQSGTLYRVTGPAAGARGMR